MWHGTAGANFGDLLEDVAEGTYEAGSTAKAVFWSACPRNNVRLEGTFLAVERQNKTAPGGWDTVSSFCDHVLDAFFLFLQAPAYST